MIEEQTSIRREIKGITDTVTREKVQDITYPAINIIVDKGTPRYKLEALSRLLTTGVKKEDSEREDGKGTSLNNSEPVSVALKSDKNYKNIGSVMPQQIKTLLSILIGVDLELEIEKGEFKDPYYIYALSSQN